MLYVCIVRILTVLYSIYFHNIGGIIHLQPDPVFARKPHSASFLGAHFCDIATRGVSSAKAQYTLPPICLPLLSNFQVRWHAWKPSQQFWSLVQQKTFDLYSPPPLFFFHRCSMAQMRGFRGTYCFLVPYLVCFMWCEFSVVLLQNSSAVGLIRTCVAYFLLLFALPVLTFGLATMMLIQIFKWFLELELTKMIVTLVVCAIPVTLRLWTRFSMSILSVFHSLTHRGLVKVILLCVSMVILFSSVYVYHAERQTVYNSTLTWDQYNQACGPPAWKTKGMAQTQIFCSHLHGHRVTWTGHFRQVRVAETENGARSVINMLPAFMGEWLRCLYGERYPKCEPKNATVANVTAATRAANGTPSAAASQQPAMLQMQEEQELCQIKALAKKACHIKRYDSYRFEVTVGRIQDGAVGDPAMDIILMASHEFRQVLLNLNPGNAVEFSTRLEGRLGARGPAFELKAINCLDCSSSLLTRGRQVKIESDWRGATMRAVKFAFDFFFSPFLSAEISAWMDNDTKITVTNLNIFRDMWCGVFFSSQDIIVYMDQQLIAVDIFKERHLQEVTLFLLF